MAILHAQSKNTAPTLSLERARLVTEAYQKYEGKVSIPELRAKTLLHIMKNKELCINPGELIVGEKGHSPQVAPTFPELICHSVEDLQIMNARELISFKVKNEDCIFQDEQIRPYWDKRCMRKKIMDAVPSKWKDCYLAGIFTEFMEQRGPGHTVGSEIIYKNGFIDFKKKIANAIATLNYQADKDATKKAEQLRAMDIACDAIITLGKRYALLAGSMADMETDITRAKELRQIEKNCKIVPAHKPETYWQAIQMYWFVHICVTSELNPWDAYSPGRLDQHLISFYENDMRADILNDDKALELLQCLWIKFNNQPAPPKVGITLKESSTYTDFANINTGGVKPDGTDGVNQVSLLILDCMDSMKLLQPSSNVQISKKTPQYFLKRALEISRKGWGQPAFYNTDAIVQELLIAGKTIEDARRGGASGCVETGAFGSEAYILTGYFNLPKILELTLNNGYDKVSGKQLGLQLGYLKDFITWDQLIDSYKQQIEYFANIKIGGSNIIESLYARNMPVPFLSIVTNDCIDSGMDYNAGGARYNTNYIQGVGIGTVSDSLAAIKYFVYDKNEVTTDELSKALDVDFCGHDVLQQKLANDAPKYGNDDDYVDSIMYDVFIAFYNCVTGQPNTKGGTYRINMLPTTCHVYFGEICGASANGRKANMPLSEGISPSQGADTNGPTAVILSATKMDHLRTGGTLLNQKFTPSSVEGDEGLEALAGLVRTYFAMDGHHVQFNIIEKATLIAAQESPEKYKDLIVRVAGYSDYFINLDKALQDEIIKRTEQCIL